MILVRNLAGLLPGLSSHSGTRALKRSLANLLASGRPAERLAGDRATTERIRLKRFFEDRLPFEEHVRELATLKLVGTLHDAAGLAEALASRCGIHISFHQCPELLRARGSTPETIQYHGNDRYTVWLPQGHSWWYREYVSLHAIGHVAAGHVFVRRNPGSGEVEDIDGHHRKRLARKPPLTPASNPGLFPSGYSPSCLSDLLLLYETEADLRARYYMRTAQLGAAALEVDRLNQLT